MYNWTQARYEGKCYVIGISGTRNGEMKSKKVNGLASAFPGKDITNVYLQNQKHHLAMLGFINIMLKVKKPNKCMIA